MNPDCLSVAIVEAVGALSGTMADEIAIEEWCNMIALEETHPGGDASPGRSLLVDRWGILTRFSRSERQQRRRREHQRVREGISVSDVEY
jgi:hypothetical protein